MDVDVLKFLVTASEHLQIASPHITSNRDLQAVDRVLPDCDWFELDARPAVARKIAAALWIERATQLDF